MQEEGFRELPGLTAAPLPPSPGVGNGGGARGAVDGARKSPTRLMQVIATLLAALTFNYSNQRINNSKHSLLQFLAEIVRRSKSSRGVTVLATYYFHRLYQYRLKSLPLAQVPEFARSSKRMFLCSLILAHKFTQDSTFSMKAWSTITGLPPKDISTMERWALNQLQYRLYVSAEDLDRWTEDVLFMNCRSEPVHLHSGECCKSARDPGDVHSGECSKRARDSDEADPRQDSPWDCVKRLHRCVT
ncbi:AAL032Wp [Eremothecium gossypii ATCC 10895]|uniref:AAL032Wp n=1 Tax=Eremothecium gossypii (strain ATCC 10895 / CBS 109.51 / FGSC 9923 / NRRL Y-1056) TaxID=284811 RepID=Q75EW0_EREGS|nr:AAL032Wp [Eremothecium gossypii ATCC 10895]AAS50334.1 AAL032Wp [Eremothecium gossypii ATCC 10895]AEY94620.1 FAAL032Wp [Eremothecium gossypii FDAG1]